MSVINLGKKLNEKSIWQIMQEIKKQIDIRDCVRFSGHTLRHTYASMQLRNGLDIYTLSSEDFIEKSIKTSTLMNLR